MSEASRGDGSYVGGGRAVLGSWWSSLFLVRNGHHQCVAGSTYLHCRRMSTTGNICFLIEDIIVFRICFTHPIMLLLGLDCCQEALEFENRTRYNEHHQWRPELQLIAWFALNRRVRH